MTASAQAAPGSEEELTSLRREVQTLRERVLELQRSAARYGEPSKAGSSVKGAVSTCQELLVEAERSVRAGSWVWEVESDGVYWSDQMYRILGYDPATDLPSSAAFFAHVHPEDRARVQQTSARCVETGIGEQVDFRLALPDGRVRYVTMTATMLFDESRRVRRVAGTLRDLTEDRLLQHGMQRSLQLLEEAQAIAQMGHWTFEVASGKLDWSAGFYRVLGLDPSAPASLELLASRIVPEDRERFLAAHVPHGSGVSGGEVEGRFLRTDGEIRTGRFKTIIIVDASGHVIESRGTVVDVTEQVMLADRLAQVGKTEAVARLAGGIAHDFNNLLTVISTSLDIWADDHDADAELADARLAVRSARTLTDRLLALGRRSHLARRPVDANELVTRTTELLRRVVSEPVRLVARLGVDLPPIDVDPTSIEQALINLVVNARDALLPGGGTIVLTTRAISGDSVAGAGASVELEVADDGPGMSPWVKSRIFEPFFTTKGEGGTGLGLPTVLGTVEQHGGSIEVDSEPGSGSRFRVRFPALPDGGVRSEPERAPARGIALGVLG
jgi:PAS domain S-box-containing protein